jgi:GAF domain-containing protein
MAVYASRLKKELGETERKQAQDALAWESRVNAAIAELSRALISPTSLDDMACLVLEQAQQLTGSAFGFVGYIDPQTGYLISPALTKSIWDVCEVQDKKTVFETFSGLWGWVLQNRQPC